MNNYMLSFIVGHFILKINLLLKHVSKQNDFLSFFFFLNLPFLKKPAEHVPLSNPAPLLVSPEVHLTPAVPSLPATVPAWPSEPTTFGPTG